MILGWIQSTTFHQGLRTRCCAKHGEVKVLIHVDFEHDMRTDLFIYSIQQDPTSLSFFSDPTRVTLKKNRCQVHAQIQPSCWCLRCIASARKNGGWNHRVYHPGYGSYEIFFGIIFSKRQFWNVLNMEDENQKFLRPSQSHRTGLTGPLFFRVHLQSLQCTEIWGWAGSRFRFQNVLLWGLSSWGYELLHSLSDARFRPTFSISNNHLEN